MNEQIMYRLESVSGEGYRDAVEVMTFEIYELQNTDILETLYTGILKEHPVAKELERLSNAVDGSNDRWNYSEMDVSDIVRKALAAIRDTTGVDVQYALWLAPMDVIENFYWPMSLGEYDYLNGIRSDHTPLDTAAVDSYITGPVVLSNLKEEGFLFGYEKLPEPLS